MHRRNIPVKINSTIIIWTSPIHYFYYKNKTDDQYKNILEVEHRHSEIIYNTLLSRPLITTNYVYVRRGGVKNAFP